MGSVSPQNAPLVRILLVDDNPMCLESYAEALTLHDLYRTSVASCAVEADKLLAKTAQPFHICLCDLGIEDLNKDQFALFHRYSSRISFIAVSGRPDFEAGHAACVAGALHAFRKPLSLFCPAFHRAIEDAFFNAVFGCGVGESAMTSLLEIRRNLLGRPTPASVSAWASACGYTDDYVRVLVRTSWNTSPRQALQKVRTYNRAFSRIISQCAQRTHGRVIEAHTFGDPATHK